VEAPATLEYALLPPGPPGADPAALGRAQAQAAPSSSVAQAARRCGDQFPESGRQWPVRAAGLLVLALLAFYLPWMFSHLATRLPWLAWPFAAASAFTGVCVVISVVNHWTRKVTPPRQLVGDEVPTVAVLIPTLGEPVPMVLRTVLSVLEQDYPAERMRVIVSDDAHNSELQVAFGRARRLLQRAA